MLSKLETEFDFLVEKGIFEIVIKHNGDILICGSYKITLNPNIEDDLLSQMAGREKFPKMDITIEFIMSLINSMILLKPTNIYSSEKL